MKIEIELNKEELEKTKVIAEHWGVRQRYAVTLAIRSLYRRWIENREMTLNSEEMMKKAKAFDVLNKKMVMGVDDYGEDGIFLNVRAAEEYDDFEEGAICISYEEKNVLMDAGL